MEAERLHTWMTAVFCCILNFLMLGLFKISGLLFIETKSHFQISRQSASLPYILSSISRSFAAPISGFAAHAYGLRIVIVTGCVISSLSIFACFFATSVWHIYILWGGVLGVGIGLTTCLLAQVINLNFKDDFSKANGLSVVGIPIAGLLLSPIIEYFLRTYSLSGAFLIISAITLHGVPVAMMLKIPPSNSRKRKSNDRKKSNDDISSVKNCDNDALCSSSQLKDQTESSYSVVNDRVTFNRQRKTKDTISVNANESNRDVENFEGKIPSTICVRVESFHNDANINYKFPSKEDYNSQALVSSTQSNNPTVLSNMADELKCTDRQHSRFTCPKSFQVFTNVSYLLIALSHGCIIFLVFTYSTICTDFALDKGMTVIESTYLLMINGATDLIGRLSFGWVTDRGYMTRANFCALFFLLSTISILWTVWATNFLTMAMAIGLQSLCTGTLFPVVLGIIPQYVEKDQQTIAIASASFFVIPFSASTPALIGYFKDVLGSYNALMYYFSSISFSNFIFLILLPHVDKWRKR